ncbi:MAG TPA: hypothetical protein VNC60_05460 [Actinomycetota bacterium]|nr:hypothetical protein [Actinomycetota bacterium]
MRIIVEHVRRAHSYLRTEAPPDPWQPNADDEAFFGLLGEMIVMGLAKGNELGDLTLSFANVTIDEPAADPMPAGDHVSVTIRGPGDWAPEHIWDARQPEATLPLVTADLRAAARRAGASFGYVRQTANREGGITVLFRVA